MGKAHPRWALCVWLRQPGQPADKGGCWWNLHPLAELDLLHHHTEGGTTLSPQKAATALQFLQEVAASPAHRVRAWSLPLSRVPQQKEATSLQLDALPLEPHRGPKAPTNSS